MAQFGSLVLGVVTSIGGFVEADGMRIVADGSARDTSALVVEHQLQRWWAWIPESRCLDQLDLRDPAKPRLSSLVASHHSRFQLLAVDTMLDDVVGHGEIVDIYRAPAADRRSPGWHTVTARSASAGGVSRHAALLHRYRC